MKKLLALILAAALALSLGACGSDSGGGGSSDESKAIAVLQAAIESLKSDGYTEFYGYSDSLSESTNTLHRSTITTAGKTSIVYLHLWVLSPDGFKWTDILGELDGDELSEIAVYPPQYPDSSYDNPESTPEYHAMYEKYSELKKQDGASTSDLDVSGIWEAANVPPVDELFTHYGTELAQAYLIGLMRGLKNPYSIEVHSAWCYPRNVNEYCFTVTISAENSFGGKVTSTYGNQLFYSLTVAGYKDAIRSSSIGNMFGIYSEDETYAQGQNAAFALDAAALQEYILANYK